MACYHPIPLKKTGRLIEIETMVFGKSETHRVSEWMFVPCGKCIGCLRDKQKQWFFRLKMEMKNFAVNSYFLTLTYSDEHIPTVIDAESGELIYCLEKRDVQLFIKRVRKHFESTPDCKLKYFCVGEFGSKTKRPHYHLLMFFDFIIDFDSLHSLCSKIWDKGMIKLGKVTDSSIMYCCKYCLKDFNNVSGNESPTYELKGELTPEYYVSDYFDPDDCVGETPGFMICSKNPAIGKGFLNIKNIEWLKSGLRNYFYVDGQKMSLPRYFKDRIFTQIEKQIIATKSQELHRQLLSQLKNYCRLHGLDYDNYINEVEAMKIEQHQQNLRNKKGI